MGGLHVVAVTGILDGMAGLAESSLVQYLAYSSGNMVELLKAGLSSGYVGSGSGLIVTGLMTAEVCGTWMEVMSDMMG